MKLRKCRLILIGSLGLAFATPVWADSVEEWGPWARDSLEEALIASGADIGSILAPTAAGPALGGGIPVTRTPAHSDPNVSPEGLPRNPADLQIPAGPTVSFANAGNSGTIRGQAIWPASARSDIDLHLVAPGGGHVAYYNTRLSLAGGGSANLDHDNILGTADDLARNVAVENIYVTPGSAGTLPAGNYDFFADAYSERTGSGTAVTVVVTGDGGVTGLQGTETLRDDQLTDVYRVRYTESSAPSYQRVTNSYGRRTP